MLQQDEVKQFVLESVTQVLAELSDKLSPPDHGDLYDDQISGSPGRIASFELDKHGKLTWWNWKSDDACARAEFPLKLKIEFGEDERRTVWLRGNSHGRGQSWNMEEHSRVARRA